MKRAGSRVLIFWLLVVSFPLMHELYKYMPALQVRGYESSATFFFWFYKSLSFFGILAAWRLSMKSFPNRLYQYGFYVLIAYGLLDLFLVYPFSSDIGYGFTLVLAVAVTPIVIWIGSLLLKWIHPGRVEKLEENNLALQAELERKRRMLREMEEQDLFRLELALEFSNRIINRLETEEDLERWKHTLQTQSREVFDAVNRIDNKVRSFN